MANLYKLTGPDGLQVMYRDGGFEGPELAYGHETYTALSIQETPIGALVTVITNPDAGWQFTLVVPAVGGLASGSQPVSTIGIDTVNNILFPAPDGQSQFNTVVSLEGSVTELRLRPGIGLGDFGE